MKRLERGEIIPDTCVPAGGHERRRYLPLVGDVFNRIGAAENAAALAQLRRYNELNGRVSGPKRSTR